MFALTPRSTQSGPTSRDPFSLMDAVFTDWLGSRPASALVSRARLEVTERNGSYEVRAELPGAKKEDIAIDIDGAWVSVTARVASQTERKDGSRVLYTERSNESFARSFELPQAVDSGGAIAKFENGVLILTLPKKDAPRSTRLAVQ